MKRNVQKPGASSIAFVMVNAMLVAVAALYFYNIFLWSDYPDFGYGFHTGTGIHTVGVLTPNGAAAGIQVGDRIVAINGKTYATIEELRKHMHRRLGEENTYLLERRGRRFTVTIKNIPTGFKRAFARSGLPFVLGLCYALIGVLVFLMKPHQKVSWTFFLVTSVFGLYLVFLFQLGTLTPGWLENFNIFAYCFAPAFIIQLAFYFPERHKFVDKHPLLQAAPFVFSATLFALVRRSTAVMAFAPKHWLIVATLYMAAAVLFFIGACVVLWRGSSSEITRLRSKVILLGFAITASLPIVDYVVRALLQVYIVPSYIYYLPFIFVFPLAVGYSIVQHDLFDIDAIIKRTYGYVLTTGAIAGLYGVFVLISNLAFGSFDFAKSPLFPLVFLLAIVFLFNPIRNRVQRFIDRVFYRLEYDYQEVVGKIGETLRSLLKLEDIGQSIMHFALQPMFVDAGAVMILNRQKTGYDCLIQSGTPEKKKNGLDAAVEVEKEDTDSGPSEVECLTLPPQDPFVEKLAQRKRATTVYDIQEDPFFHADRGQCLKTFEQLEATLVVPLIYEDQLIGMICLGRKKSGKFYRREDIRLLNTLANQSAVAIENALMVEEVIEKERMEEELSIARDLQVSMLPAECPHLEGFEFAAFSDSAREVGGDFYDFIEISDHRLGIVIGDVTGKSVSGALVMAASRSIFRMLGEEKLTVGESMMRANRRTKKDIKSGMFVALLYAVINAADKRMDLCSAGQTQPIFRSAVTGEATLVQTRGDTFPLGILEEAQYEETRLQLQSGDAVVFYTDGIVEAMNPAEEMFGFNRLLEVVKNSPAKTAEALLAEIKNRVYDFVSDAAQHDDITIITVRAL